jgi:predicted amidohydrolase YtcJ
MGSRQRMAPQFFAEGAPTREKLDVLVPDRPPVFYGQDGHSAWANSLALKAAGIDRNTPEPPRGRIERDSQTGEPAGTLGEAACELVDAHVPKPDYALYEKGLRDAMDPSRARFAGASSRRLHDQWRLAKPPGKRDRLTRGGQARSSRARRLSSR